MVEVSLCAHSEQKKKENEKEEQSEPVSLWLVDLCEMLTFFFLQFYFFLFQRVNDIWN